MRLRNLILHEEWGDFYISPKDPTEVKNYTEKTAYTIASDQNIYFHDSVVIGLQNRVIIFEGTNSKALIESCKFDNISGFGKEGSTVRFVSSSSQIVQNKICSNNCNMTSRNNGVYTFQSVTNSADSINFVVECSIVKSSSKDGGETIELYYGEMKLSNNNLTDSDTRYIPAFYFSSPSKDANISFMKINNNIGRNSNGCSHHWGSFIYHYSYCDISSNQCPDYGIFYFNTNCEFSSCNIMNNAASTNFLFYMDSGTLTYSSCYINNPNANQNYKANVNTNYQNPINFPLFQFGCIEQIISIQKNFQITCNTESHCEKNIYRIIAFITS